MGSIKEMLPGVENFDTVTSYHDPVSYWMAGNDNCQMNHIYKDRRVEVFSSKPNPIKAKGV